MKNESEVKKNARISSRANICSSNMWMMWDGSVWSLRSTLDAQGEHQCTRGVRSHCPPRREIQFLMFLSVCVCALLNPCHNPSAGSKNETTIVLTNGPALYTQQIILTVVYRHISVKYVSRLITFTEQIPLSPTNKSPRGTHRWVSDQRTNCDMWPHAWYSHITFVVNELCGRMSDPPQHITTKTQLWRVFFF